MEQIFLATGNLEAFAVHAFLMQGSASEWQLDEHVENSVHLFLACNHFILCRNVGLDLCVIQELAIAQMTICLSRISLVAAGREATSVSGFVFSWNATKKRNETVLD